jgi:hypothetical protein
MTHFEITTEFARHNLSKGGIITVLLNDGNTIRATLSDSRVFGEQDENGLIINSQFIRKQY